MPSKTVSFVDMFFDLFAAYSWVDTIMEANLDDNNNLERMEIVRMPGGGWRAGVIFSDNQYELFGASEDA